jgi:hypothetical protein
MRRNGNAATLFSHNGMRAIASLFVSCIGAHVITNSQSESTQNITEEMFTQ